jgi:hypothetical protein
MLSVLATNPKDIEYRVVDPKSITSLHRFLERFPENGAMPSEDNEVDVKHEYDQPCKQRTYPLTYKSRPHLVARFVIRGQPE